MKKDLLNRFHRELSFLQGAGNLRFLPRVHHYGKEVEVDGSRMLNLSSNDYLGLAADRELREEFMEASVYGDLLFSSSSSRLLTGNFPVCEELETLLSRLFGTESALVFSSGYHMNSGILPAVCDSHTLILADKLVHASLIDGIRLCTCKYIRYAHTDYDQLESLLKKHHREYETVIIVTESIFSMDGDEADLNKLVELKKQYPGVMLYVDEAHGVGVRGKYGLGCAEEQGCIHEIDFLVGTFGKALASMGAYLVCRKIIRDYLVNKMRTLIFTTALPPVNLMWTKFILERLDTFYHKRELLKRLGASLKSSFVDSGYPCASTSHIVPMLIGESNVAICKADELRKRGFYALPVRPPTVPEGTSRIRFSLSASLTEEEVIRLTQCLRNG